MATRISFSTTYPDRMGLLKGKFTRFPEKLIAGLDMDEWIEGGYRWDMREAGYNIQISNITNVKHPKTTTIRSNYEYWKSKEGQLLQPFFWAGRPYHSKHVVFCPEVRLRRVRKIETIREKKWVLIGGCNLFFGTMLKPIIQHEGFDDPDHFWMWFDNDFNGALLKLESVEG